MKIACYGDSNTWGYDPRNYFGGRYDKPWPEILADLSGWNVLNQGMNGQCVTENEVNLPDDLDLLIIMLGTNDLLEYRSPESICEKMERFLKNLTTRQYQILLLAPPYMSFGEWVPDKTLIDQSEIMANLYQKLAQSLNILFMNVGEMRADISFDGVHMTHAGHKKLAEKLYNYLNKGE